MTKVGYLLWIFEVLINLKNDQLVSTNIKI